jgi:intracellular sulfur oxidation DsrE/DsrF family protein
MSDPLAHVTPRRGFLGRLAAAGAAFAGVGVAARSLGAQAPAPASATTSAAPPPAPRAGAAWDLSWVDRVRGTHRQLFDAPELAEATVLHQARTWMAGFAEVYGTKDADMSAVLVIRHAAIPMVLNDALWDRTRVAKALSEAEEGKVVLRDPATGELARRNPFLNANVKPGDRYSMLWPDGGLDSLIARGAIVLACNLALRRAVSLVQRADRVSADEARRTVLANLVPGVVVMPSGIFAVARAQEAGCQYIRAT